jgi:Universal stress protein family.
VHADLIVQAGRSHALRQVFGAVTRYLLEHATIPVLLSHWPVDRRRWRRIR